MDKNNESTFKMRIEWNDNFEGSILIEENTKDSKDICCEEEVHKK